MKDVIECLDIKIAHYEGLKEQTKSYGWYAAARSCILKRNQFILAKKILIEGCKEGTTEGSLGGSASD